MCFFFVSDLKTSVSHFRLLSHTFVCPSSFMTRVTIFFFTYGQSLVFIFIFLSRGICLIPRCEAMIHNIPHPPHSHPQKNPFVFRSGYEHLERRHRNGGAAASAVLRPSGDRKDFHGAGTGANAFRPGHVQVREGPSGGRDGGRGTVLTG